MQSWAVHPIGHCRSTCLPVNRHSNTSAFCIKPDGGTLQILQVLHEVKRKGSQESVGAVSELYSFGVDRGVRLAYAAFADLRKEAPSAELP